MRNVFILGGDHNEALVQYAVCHYEIAVKDLNKDVLQVYQNASSNANRALEDWILDASITNLIIINYTPELYMLPTLPPDVNIRCLWAWTNNTFLPEDVHTFPFELFPLNLSKPDSQLPETVQNRWLRIVETMHPTPRKPAAAEDDYSSMPSFTS